MKRFVVILALVLFPTLAFAQSALLQGGSFTAGHMPMYVGAGSSQVFVQDSGPAGGGGPGLGLSELLLQARGTGTAPYSGQGTGPYGTNSCDYDAPVSNATGYHYLCFTANGTNGNGIIAFGAGGGAAQTALDIIFNGTTYAFPFITSGVVGPATTVSGDAACWNNVTGTLLKDCGGPLSLAGQLTTSGAYASTFTMTGATTVTFPTTGTLATTANANVASVSGTAGQITVSPTTGATVVSLPSTITQAETFSSAVVMSASSGNSITAPTISMPSLTFGTGSSQNILATSVNTGFSNALQSVNGGTVSNAGTTAYVLASLSAGSNTNISMQALGGASPSGFLATGSGLTGGFTISAGAGALNITSPTISTPSFTFATGSAAIITAASGNTGFANALVSSNSGTSSNAGTIAELQANLGCANCNVEMFASGGSSPSASLASASGLTGGFNISAGAGALSLTAPTLSGLTNESGQLEFSYGTPTIGSGGCGSGTNGTLASGSTNQAGEVIIASASTTSCQISFSTTLAATPLGCVLFPANATAAAAGTTVARVSAISTSSWTITGSALASSDYYYHCI